MLFLFLGPTPPPSSPLPSCYIGHTPWYLPSLQGPKGPDRLRISIRGLPSRTLNLSSIRVSEPILTPSQHGGLPAEHSIYSPSGLGAYRGSESRGWPRALLPLTAEGTESGSSREGVLALRLPVHPEGQPRLRGDRGPIRVRHNEGQRESAESRYDGHYVSSIYPEAVTKRPPPRYSSVDIQYPTPRVTVSLVFGSMMVALSVGGEDRLDSCLSEGSRLMHASTHSVEWVAD